MKIQELKGFPEKREVVGTKNGTATKAEACIAWGDVGFNQAREVIGSIEITEEQLREWGYVKSTVLECARSEVKVKVFEEHIKNNGYIKKEDVGLDVEKIAEVAHDNYFSHVKYKNVLERYKRNWREVAKAIAEDKSILVVKEEK